EAVVQAPAPHVGQWCNLDHAALEVLRYPIGLEHVVQSVEQRTQIRVHLGHQIAGEEAESLPCLDSRSREDHPVYLSAAERRCSERYREEGLSCAGGPDAEGDRV